MTRKYRVVTRTLGGLLFAASALGAARQHKASSEPVPVTAKLSEWKVELSEADGRGRHRHASRSRTQAASPTPSRSKGRGIEQETALIQPGSSATLTLTLRPGTYEVYCPVGEDSHKKLGMETHLKVVSAKSSGSSGYGGIKTRESQAAAGEGAGDPGDGRGPGHPDPPRPVPVRGQRRSDPQGVRRRARGPGVAGAERAVFEQCRADHRQLHLHRVGQGRHARLGRWGRRVHDPG